jgi:hypothetical protein
MTPDQIEDTTGTIWTPRHPAVRWRIGYDSGECFAPGQDYDGLTLTLEAASPDDARAMLRAVECFDGCLSTLRRTEGDLASARALLDVVHELSAPPGTGIPDPPDAVPPVDPTGGCDD